MWVQPDTNVPRDGAAAHFDFSHSIVCVYQLKPKQGSGHRDILALHYDTHLLSPSKTDRHLLPVFNTTYELQSNNPDFSSINHGLTNAHCQEATLEEE